MVTKTLAIAGNTFLETIRQPIYGIMLILTCMMMVFNVSLAAYTLDDDNLLLKDLGLSTLLVSGLFLAAFSAAGVLTREIDNKTVMTVISKPVNRATLIFGKFIGLISALTVAFYIGMIALLLVIRHEVMMNTTDPWDWPVLIFGIGALLVTFVVGAYGNFMYGWQFSSSAVALAVPLMTLAGLLVAFIDKEWHLQKPLSFETPQLLGAIFLVYIMVLIFTTIALAVSCRFGQVATLTVCVVILMAGLTSDYFFGRHAVEGGLLDQPSIAGQLCYVAYRIVPNFSIFWVSDALSAGKQIHFAYVVYSSLYGVLYIIAFLMLGIAIFQKREVG